jgi:hypothetical protein
MDAGAVPASSTKKKAFRQKRKVFFVCYTQPMKTAILLHSTGGRDSDYYWFADTRQYLETNGYKVWWPLLPHTDARAK